MKKLFTTLTGTLIITVIGVSGLVTFPGGGQALQSDGLDTAIYPPTNLQTAVASTHDEERDGETIEPGIPKKLTIPAIDIDAQIEQVGLTKKGAMQNPSSWFTVGWYKLGARPGSMGSAVIAGHLDSDTGPAVFWDIEKLQPGDTITVTDDGGNEWNYTVDRLESYPLKEVPMQELFGPTEKTQLVLVTCEGEWIEQQGYDERLVVFASFVSNKKS